ncbi:MAG: glycosyltransferase, partial [Burkholderiales bacterium]|nr:glycosyltransferase [Burkholderiales bacterium]
GQDDSGRPLLRQRLDLAAALDRLDPMCAALLARMPAGVPMPEQGRLPWEVPTEIEGRDYLDPAPWEGLAAERRARPPASGEPIDVIVPVYAGSQESLRCLWAVLSAPVRHPYALVVVDDASPEPALSAMLWRLSQLGLLELLVNRDNLGFVRSVNRALSLHPGRDAVLLNADTCVHGDWLDRLAAHLQRDARAASVTPLSNNATIFSYPRQGLPNGAGRGPLRLQAAQVDRLLAGQGAAPVVVPSGVGFCMLMRGSALQQVGLLDAERFGRGYGEENDWCLRAHGAGWHHLAATDVFVWHDGSVSFKGEAESRTLAAVQLLLERYPDYQRRVDDWLRDDPLAGVRARLDADRLREALDGRGLALLISHDRGGGTLRHEEEQADRLRAQGLEVLWMRPAERPGAVSLVAPRLGALPNLAALPVCPAAGAEDLLGAVLGRLALRQLQLHHLADHDDALAPRLMSLSAALDIPLEATVHDYRMLCPRINLVDAEGRFCGDPIDPAICRRCLAADGLDQQVGDIADWRARHHGLLRAAARVVVPDEDVAQRLRRHWPELSPEVVPHEPPIVVDRRAWEAPLALQHIVVVGALSPVKGFEVLRRLAASPAARQRGWRFTLLGHSSDDAALQAAGVEVLGRYEDSELPQRLQVLAPDLLLVPSIWPETYCYVLSAALASGRPVAAFDLGAQARRLREAGLQRFLLPLAESLDPEALVQRLARAARPWGAQS